mgnify:CR=1 FL=1
MNYAWEAVLAAETQGMGRDRLRFVEAASPSPYMEVSVEDLNMDAPDGERVEINPLYRFEDVLGGLFDRNTEDLRQTREIFFDVCMHYFTQLDLREGLSRREYYRSLAAGDIRDGCFGDTAGKRFALFDGGERKIILRAYLRLLENGNYRGEFRRAVTGLYPHAFIYENNETAYELLVYLGAAETDRERGRAAFLREMFLPVQETVHFFYGHHFGIIGVDETMALDEMVLF